MKGYVGKTVNPQIRYRDHWVKRKTGVTYKDRWLRKLPHRPQFIILEWVQKSRWQSRERRWIRDLRKGGLQLVNTAIGGMGASAGRTLSQVHRRKISQALKGNKNGIPFPKGNVYSKEVWTGRKHSQETREKIRKSRLGKPSPPKSKTALKRLSERMMGNKIGIGNTNARRKEVPE